MAVLNYPIPKLDVTLQEAGRVLQLILSPEEYSDFQSALSQHMNALTEVHVQLTTTSWVTTTNWVTHQFKQRLLSTSDPLPTSTAIPAVLPQSKFKGEGAQLERAAALLWAAAKLYSEPSLVEGEVPTERTQQSEIFAASRLPGKDQDQIKVYPESLHAMVTCRAGIFPVPILQRSGAEGTVCPVPLPDLYTQLAGIMGLPAAADPQDHPTICRLSAFGRREWHAVRDEILKAGGEAAKSLGVMESSILALALEDTAAPADLADTLNAVRLGGGTSQCLRYYDKVTNMVVFRDGVAGMLFEHSTVDGMVAGLVVGHIWTLSESQDREQKQTPAPTDGPGLTASPRGPLRFPLGHVNIPAPPLGKGDVQRSSPIVTFEFPSYRDAFSTLRGQRGLYDAWITFALQLSLKQTLGEAAAHCIMVTPTHMRHYKHGRCDPTFSITAQSRELVAALGSCAGPGDMPRRTEELLALFHLAFVEHKRLIKATKGGNGVGPHIGVLRNGLSQDNALKRFLDRFGCPSIYLTGSDLLEGIECAVGNVYARDQLAVTYLGKEDKVRLSLNAKGTFADVLGKLVKRLKQNLELVMMLAIRYAIAGQMGAIECLFETNKDLEASNKNNEQSPDPPVTEKPDFTLVIHGGAGEEMLLNNSVIEVTEFGLRTALTLGARVLSRGGSSLDAVQRSVRALEDCFLFNAGKGSVCNRNGQHEMEATIVDGHNKNSGAVACLRHIKNPVSAARKVMDNSVHTLLSGEGAEEFLESLEEKEKTEDADYFHTDLRYRQLTVKQSSDTNNHPQTVGAVAVDGRGRLAAASSTGGLVGKWKGRIGDTAVVGAGIYADDKLAVTCSGDGDAFLRHTVAHRVASLYNLKGYSLRQACREVLDADLGAQCAGIIAVDHKREAAVESNVGVMFVGTMIGGVAQAKVIRNFANVIWETDELVAYLHPNPWTPGTTVLTRKVLSGPSSIFHLTSADYEAMLLGAQTVATLLCDNLGVHRCALLSMPQPDKPAHIKIFPLHGLEHDLKPYLSETKEFHTHHPGYCTSNDGPSCEDSLLDQIQTRITNHLPMSDAPPCYDFHGNQSHDDLFTRIVRGTEKHWRVWEDGEHVAFLTPVPNRPGTTVVAPRKPLLSDLFRLDTTDYRALIVATRKVAQLLEKGMEARGVALIFEGLQINYAHTKLLPLVTKPGETPAEVPPQFCPEYRGYVTSVDGPPASTADLENTCTKIKDQKPKIGPPRTWENPESHSVSAINSQWYRNLFQIQDTLFHSTVEYFSQKRKYAYALTPTTTDTISSPMGLGSDSEPVSVNLLNQETYLADSMQFALEYFLRFQEGLPGTYYISTSFRGEEPDDTHLNQFYHVECELLGDMDAAISVAEGYVAHLTRAMLKNHPGIILEAAGTLRHAQDLIGQLEKPLPRVPLDGAISGLPADCFEWVKEGRGELGRKLTRKGETALIERYGGALWLTEMDHPSVPFYQAYVEGSGGKKAKAADLLLGLGETLGLGQRHSTPETVQQALRHHEIPEESYKWYIDMKGASPLSTSGWGMGVERYLCWLLQHNDVRDIPIIPRLKGKKYMP